MVNSSWDQWVIGYNMDKQRQFFADWASLARLAHARLWLVAAV
jgi:hypothetical protein